MHNMWCNLRKGTTSRDLRFLRSIYLLIEHKITYVMLCLACTYLILWRSYDRLNSLLFNSLCSLIALLRKRHWSFFECKNCIPVIFPDITPTSCIPHGRFFQEASWSTSKPLELPTSRAYFLSSYRRTNWGTARSGKLDYTRIIIDNSLLYL